MTCWISYRTNFRRAARRFWLKIEVPRITKMIFLLVLSKDISKISSLKFLFTTTAEAATSCPKEGALEFPLEVGKTNWFMQPLRFSSQSKGRFNGNILLDSSQIEIPTNHFQLARLWITSLILSLCQILWFLFSLLFRCINFTQQEITL